MKSIVLKAVFFLLALAPVIAPAAGSGADTALLESRRAAEVGAVSEALSILDRFIANNPKSADLPEIFMEAARLYERNSQWEQAAMYYERVADDYATHALAPTAAFGAANAYRNAGRVDASRAGFIRLIEKFPSAQAAGDARNALADIYSASGDTQEAVVQLEALAKGALPNLARQARYRLLDLYMKVDDLEKARKTAMEILREAPGHQQILMTLASIHEKEEAFPEALAIVRKLRETEPLNEDFKKRYFSLLDSSGKLNLRIAELEAEKEKKPNDPAAYTELADIYLWRDSPIEALRELEYVVKLRPDDVEKSLLLAKLLFENGWKTKAIEVCEGVLERHPGNQGAWQRIGDVHFSEKRMAEALESWKKSMFFDPGNTESWRQLSNFLMFRQLYPEAMEILEEGRRRFNSPGLFARELATLYEGQMKLKEAVDEYARMLDTGEEPPQSVESKLLSIMERDAGAGGYAIEKLMGIRDIVRNSLSAHEIIAVLHVGAGNIDATLELLDEFTAKGGTPDILSNVGHRLAALRKHGPAAALFEKAAETFPPERRPDALFNAALNSEKAGNKREAARIYETLTTTYPSAANAPYAMYLLASLRMEEGNGAGARDMYEKLIKTAPGSQWAWSARVDLADAYITTGDPGKALEALNELKNTNAPFLDRILFIEAEASHYLNHAGDARRLYDQLISSYPDSESVNDAISRLLFLRETEDAPELSDFVEAELDAMRGVAARAETAFNEMAASESKVAPFALFALAKLHRAAGNREKAAAELESLETRTAPDDLKARGLFMLVELELDAGDTAGAVTVGQRLFSLFPNTFWADAARDRLNRAP